MEKGEREVSLAELKTIIEVTGKPIEFFLEEKPEEDQTSKAFNHGNKIRNFNDLDDEALEAVDKLVELLRKNSTDK